MVVKVIRAFGEQENEFMRARWPIRHTLRHAIALGPNNVRPQPPASACNAKATRHGMPIRSLGLSPGYARARSRSAFPPAKLPSFFPQPELPPHFPMFA